jgi:hypothetical protein
LRLLSAPYFVPLFLRSGMLRSEFNARYCRPCRRQVNVSLLFIAFLVVIFATTIAIQKLGMVGGAAH